MKQYTGTFFKDFVCCLYFSDKLTILLTECIFYFRYRAIYAYKPMNDDELELWEQDEVYVMEKCDDGWYVGTSCRTGMFGTFPGNYVQRVQCK